MGHALLRRLLRCLRRTSVACLLCLPAAPAYTTTPLRVVSLAPHITEMIFAAGAGHTLVGTVTSSDYPQPARQLPKVGDGATHISIEKLASLAPTLVLAWQHAGAVAASASTLQALGLPIEYVAPESLHDIPDQIEHLGQRLGTPDHAARTAADLRTTLQTLHHHYAHRPTVSVYIEIGHTPLYAAGNDPLLNNALNTCGGTNVFAHHRQAAVPIGPEHILQAQPDIILLAQAQSPPPDHTKARHTALGLPDTTTTQVHTIDPDTLFRPGPRLIHATQKLCQILESARNPQQTSTPE